MLAASINISPRALHLSSQRALAASHNPPPPHAVNPLEKVQADHACIPLRFDPAFGRLLPNHVMPTDKIHPGRLIFVPRQWDPCAFSLITCTAAACLHRQLGANPPAHPSPDPCIRTPVNPLFADTHSLCFLNAAPRPPPPTEPPPPPHLPPPPTPPPVCASGRASPLISSCNKQPGKHHETFKGGSAASFPLICAGKLEMHMQKKKNPQKNKNKQALKYSCSCSELQRDFRLNLHKRSL